MNVRVLLLMAGAAEELEVVDRNVWAVLLVVDIHSSSWLLTVGTQAVLHFSEKRNEDVAESFDGVMILLSIGGSHWESERAFRPSGVSSYLLWMRTFFSRPCLTMIRAVFSITEWFTPLKAAILLRGAWSLQSRIA
jgi:hypothetical protein